MWIFYLLSYLMLAGLVAAFMCFPSWRGHAAQAVQATRHWVWRHWSWQRWNSQHCVSTHQGTAPRWSPGTAWVRWHGRLRHAVQALRRRPWRASGALLVLAAPVLVATLGRPDAQLPEQDFDGRSGETLIPYMLAAEPLAPPLPLPPAWFTTPEIRAEQPQLAAASRDWKQLKPEFVQRLLLVFKRMSEQGYQMAILEGYRSPQRQAELQRMGPAVTRAGPGQSWHQYGLAADCAFVRDGKLVISEKDPWAMRGYVLYGQAAKAVGLTWGGDWTMGDFGHTELPDRSLKGG